MAEEIHEYEPSPEGTSALYGFLSRFFKEAPRLIGTNKVRTVRAHKCVVCGGDAVLIYRGLKVCEECHGWRVYKDGIFIPATTDQEKELEIEWELRKKARKLNQSARGPDVRAGTES